MTWERPSAPLARCQQMRKSSIASCPAAAVIENWPPSPTTRCGHPVWARPAVR
jgi:hypothetical protein